MDASAAEGALSTRDGGCVCRGVGGTLGILEDVRKAYEERLSVVERVGGAKKLQMQVDVFRSWVSDLVAQNTLLARALEELETEATTSLSLERSKHNEIQLELRAELAALRRRLTRKDSDLRGLVEVLRRLREFDYCTLEGIHFFEVTESDIFGTVQWMLMGLPRFCSASGMFAQAHADDFYAIMRKRTASLLNRIRASSNSILKVIAWKHDSHIMRHFVQALLERQNKMEQGDTRRNLKQDNLRVRANRNFKLV